MFGVISKRCDEAMRRSKEKCFKGNYKKWKCTGECSTCFCCIIRRENGDEEHIDIRRKQI